MCECSTGWWTMQWRREVCLSIPGFLQWITLLWCCKTKWCCKSRKRILAQTVPELFPHQPHRHLLRFLGTYHILFALKTAVWESLFVANSCLIETLSSPATSTSTLLPGDPRTTARQWTDPDHSPRKRSSMGWVFVMAWLLIQQPFCDWFPKFSNLDGKRFCC